MALALDAPFAPIEATAHPDDAAAGVHATSVARAGALAVPALASMAAGAVHVAASGTHSEYQQAVLAFVFVGAAQVAVGAAAMGSRRRAAGVLLAAVNVAVLVGWYVTKRNGVSFVDGLETADPFRRADLVAAGFATVAVLGAMVVLLRGMRVPRRRALLRAVGVPMAALTLTGMAWAATADHPGEEEGPASSDFAPAQGEETVLKVRPYIPGEPIDLSGYDGVTPAEEAEAETILASTLYFLPQLADPEVAAARGWTSIGDAATGDEHYVNSSTFDDGKILDPTAPESLVYEMIDGKKTLVAAMFMLWPGATFADIPSTGGDLMQWHIHDNLCFNEAGRVAGLRVPGGECPDGLSIGGETPMIHVWIKPHPCGPFAALEGIAGGTIANGEARLCDRVHGAPS